MKYVFLSLCLLVFPTLLSKAQEAPCGTQPLRKETIKEIERISDQYRGISMTGITHLPIKIQLTRSTSDGTNYYAVSQVVYEVS